jgi:DNA ligase (NAD+)
VRGEAVIQYSDFERINAEIPDTDAKYKNPRNLCSGTVRQLNSEICAKRNVYFFAFNLIDVGALSELNTFVKRFEWLSQQGFDVVAYQAVTASDLERTVAQFSEKIATNDFPSDGLVLSYDDIAYGNSLGTTAKFPRGAIAFKWRDETVETTFREVFWSASRTGLINPVAVFDPVEIEGTTVSRASLHNVSILESYELGEGDTITVFKANMIIPQLAENRTRSNTLSLPNQCPVCANATEVREDNGVRVLVCVNPDCPAKKIKTFAHFVSRDAMNIDGLSEATLEKFIQNGFLHTFDDLYHLERFKDEITTLEGFGERSYNNLIDAVNKSREVSLANFINSLGIANVGLSNAKLLARHCDYDVSVLRGQTVEELLAIDGIGETIAVSIVDYFSNPEYNRVVDALLGEITFANEETLAEEAQILQGQTFVVTGTLQVYANRNAIKAEIERLGGKVAGSVSSKTNYLINNDSNSGSSKNKKAKELSIPILTEEDFISMLKEGQ